MSTTAEPSAAPKPTILCVAPFNNPHIVPFYDTLAADPSIDVERASLRALPTRRIELGWAEMDTSEYIQPWKSIRNRYKYFRLLLKADLVVFPGFFHFRTLWLHHWLRRLTRRPALLWSEAFLDDPRSQPEHRMKTWARKLLLKPCNSKNYHFLAVGAGAEDDYRSLGMTRWNYYQFLFTVSPRSAPAARESPSSTTQLLFCGSLEHLKGVDLLLRALATERLLRLDWTLTIIGDGPDMDQLVDLAEKGGIADRLHFLGALPHDDVFDAMSGHDVLILPSRYDGWGAVVNEAMECGLAIIVSDHVGARRPLVVHGENGYIFHSESVPDLAEKLERVSADPEELERMQLRSFEMIKRFSPAAIAQPFAAFCRHILADLEFESPPDILNPLK